MMREDNLNWRYWLLCFGLVVSFGILMVATIRLTVIRSDYYRSLAFANKIEEIHIPSGRGDILDRKGRIVAKSVYQYFTVDNGIKTYKNSGDFSGSMVEGKDVAVEVKRKYTYAESMGLITGYVGMVTAEELADGSCGIKLTNTDVVGRGGVEEFSDCSLRGSEGKRLVEVDARGKYVRELGREEPQKGLDLELSLDAFWQDKIYKLLNGRKGTVIMSTPKTGKIIAIVSSPSVDANAFSYQIDNVAINRYLQDKEGLPLINRAITVKYHPGSVYKMVMATAGLETGVIDKETTIEDTGMIKIGDYSFSNWAYSKSGVKDGMVSIVGAIKRSNDIFFYKLGERLGVDSIKEWSNKFGFGQKTGVELAAETSGITPDDKWKQDNKGERWYLGDTYHLSIGQGFLAVTPLQVNLSTNIIANNGVKCKMSLLKNSKVECANMGIKTDTVRAVKEGMLAACQPGGTAWPLFNFKTKLACKTGTAEVGDGSKDTHAWLTAFAPADDPEISITVMVERGGEGSDVAAPIVGDILKEWFNEPDTKVPRYTSETDKKIILE